ncbi:MAG: FAD-dependent oxidoreductase [Deltaproteobacteria bacterium]|nr:FAD-dependent oxidoreductase [Deltaproteobacteria bacterium]MBW1921914.1 FAD-dependent oxidoreductase [Deltaproteobacteria bacterium]MBW1948818.1 FAD-dependent oxidoreductase [Deltaproteobacteria bacterium]MBW2008758.1 FAD-dependent oxidoreductase [Deltaproteobacteria bacterium]MBW2102733.1 FAD-dependent oxidoreductase [Deltaproteobacteria bacterium]
MSRQVLIIGAVALGPKAACRFKRLEPESRVVMIDQGEIISYGGCGIPYFISGDVSEPDQLQSTSFHMLRDPRFFRDVKDVEVLTRTRALSINRKQKVVAVRDERSGETSEMPYDLLVLATGSVPNRLPIPGTDLDGVFTVSNIEEAVAIRNRVSRGLVEQAVVVGAGAIGLEVAEALSDLWGVETSVVEIRDQILAGFLGRNLARMAHRHLQTRGVEVNTGETVLRFEGEGKVERVVTDQRILKADLVIMAVGVRPNAHLAREAGLELTPGGGVAVNERLQTSDPAIYAGGDCVEITHLITGKPAHFPLGSLANRQGRVIGTNLAGGNAVFEGAVGSWVMKIFDISVAGAGLTLGAAKTAGFDAASTLVVQFDRAHFFPEKDLMYLELVVEKGSGRVLGIQGLGNKGDGMVGRINAVAAILKDRPTTADISNLELPYSPPFSSAMDILNALGNTAENMLEGRNRTADPDFFAQCWEERGTGETLVIDCRAPRNAEPYVRSHPWHWKNIPQDELRRRLDEVPRDRKLLLVCNTGVRSFEAQRILDQAGISDTLNVQGGVAALKKCGLDPAGEQDDG